MKRRRIWSELLPLEEVRAPRVLALLGRYGLELAVAVRPETAAGLPELMRAAAGAGVPVVLWPMIADADGRWASADNAPHFQTFVSRIVGSLDGAGIAAREVVLDLEPPFPLVQPALQDLGALWRLLRRDAGPDAGAAAYRAMVAALAAGGVEVTATITPLLLLDGAGRGWERTLGTPVLGVGWGRVNVMIYTSLLEGWSRGLLRRADALALLRLGCRAAERRFEAAGGVSLGVVGVGALGDEPVYRDVSELREDVAAAVAAGVDDLALFDLGGVLARPPAEAWLEAFTETPAGRAGDEELGVAGLTRVTRDLRPRALMALGAAGFAQIARRAARPW